MSDNVLKLIPTSPNFTPSAEAQEKARILLRTVLPQSDGIHASERLNTVFVDPGGNLESISCPQCKRILETEWWQGAMDKAHETGLQELATTLPCCGAASSLNDLIYDWPAGFARFILDARNPGVKELAPEQIRELEQVLGCQLRMIWAHD